jgi:diguanylate cyclase (GGDEF)-like protein/PAS domain S-box-containing protein
VSDVADLAAHLAASRILVIDDNQAIHQDFRKILGAGRSRSAPSAAELALLGGGAGPDGAAEFRIDSAYQGQEGLELVRLAQEQGSPYAMAFVDVRMPPGWDGIETTAQIWRRDPDIQIVICTAFSDYSWSEMLAKLGRSDRLLILKKPFDTIEVVQLASALTEKWRLARQSRSTLGDLERQVAERTRELVHSGERMQASETQYRLLFDSNPHPMWVYDIETLRFLTVNGAAVKHYGYSEQEFLAMTLRDIRPAQDIATLEKNVAVVRDQGNIFRVSPHRKRDGSLIDVEISTDRIVFDGRSAGLVLAHDVTVRQEADRKIKRLNRVYAVLSGITTLIVRVHGRDELFKETCRVAVEAGGFRMAWIGIVDKAAGVVRPVASAGEVRDFFESAPMALTANTPSGHGLSGRAVRTMQPLVSNDVASDPQRMMKKALAERGVNSLAVIPLIVGGEAIGVLAFYSADIGFFDDEEMKLLVELAGNIAFALDHIEKAEKLERMTRVNAMLSGINGAIVRIRGRQELFEEACRIAVETGGLRFAWLCLVDEAEMRLRPVASAGSDDGFMETIRDRLSLRDGAPGGHGVGAKAVRERRALALNDVQANADFKYTMAHADQGIRSVAALPLLIAGRAVGALALYAGEVGFFDDDEMKLLNEVSSNIAFGLEHIEKEEKVQRLTRVYAVLSGVNSLIVRARDRDELFREACRIAVEEGALPMAWIGIVDPSIMRILLVASAGVDEGLLSAIKNLLSSSDGVPLGNNMAARAIREKKAGVSNDARNDPKLVLSRNHLESGLRSMAMLPLIVSGEAVGVFGLYSNETGFFDEEEMKLLTELAGDIAFALENISRQQTLDKLSRIRAVSSEINAAIVRIREREALLEETSRIVSEHGKFEMIWIGAIDHDRQQVQAVCWKGFSEQAARAVSWASIGNAKGTLGEAMQTRKASVRNDIEGELPGGTLRAEALKLGRRSSVCLPLVVDDRVTALVVLFATGRGFFDEEELRLLNGLAGDISFALQAIDKQQRLDYLAYYDALTGLANRSLFLERVAQYTRSAAAGGHKLALFMIDLERFKNINDSLGRPAGDALLKQVAQWLARSAGDANLVARVDADHFAAVVPEVRQGGNLGRLLEQEIASIGEHPFRLNDAAFRIALKVGVALFPDDGADADSLFRNAEAALKKAKASGDRYLFYTQGMTAAVASELTLENQLRQALDKEEFVLHYQPKVDLASGKLTGVEALIRWNDPRTGLVPPARFIPILEETGLIYDVGRWALRRAIADYLRWRAAGLPAVRVAVNVSPLQLRNRGFIAEIEQAVGIDAHAAAGLELEITENVIMADVKHNIANLQAIRALGVTIAIDDFGTGFSSLSYLSKLPVDTLKIDRSFVIDMTTGPQGFALVSTIISLAHSLKLKVVAEGVETEEQARLLRSLSCDEMQGYLFSKPLPGEIFETKFLTRLQADESPVAPAAHV